MGNQTTELNCKVSGAGGTDKSGASWGRWAPGHTGAADCVSHSNERPRRARARGTGGPSLRGLRCPGSRDASLLPVEEKKTQPLGAALSSRWQGQASCGAQARGRRGWQDHSLGTPEVTSQGARLLFSGELGWEWEEVWGERKRVGARMCPLVLLPSP